MKSRTLYRIALALAISGSLLLTWANLAVGFIGNEANPLNAMYFAVPAIGLLGALVARFRAAGMVYALTAMAVVQGLVAVYAQVQGHFTWVMTVVFAGLWLISATLFRRAARGR